MTDVRSVIAPDDRSYDQSWRPIVRSIVVVVVVVVVVEIFYLQHNIS